jgi:hypothetical protein
MSSPAKIAAQDQKIAVLLALQGQEALKRGGVVEAEKLFKDAVSRDKNNPALYTYLASLYETQAKQLGDPNLWNEAAGNWHNAWSRVADQPLKDQYGTGAATGYYMYASIVSQSGDLESRSHARDALYEAKATAPKDSEVYRLSSALLDDLLR